jgi:hydrogenase expression/formation protein HypC
MCLAVPGKVIERQGELARVDFRGSELEISMMLTPDAQPGEWVLVHAGFAIAAIKEADALETWDYLRKSGIEGVEAGP